MKRVALLLLPVFVVGLVVLAVIVLRRRSRARSETMIIESEESVLRTDPSEEVGHGAEEPRTPPTELTPHGEVWEEEQELRHGALQHLSTEPLAPRQV
jgi:hypothetical protein